ncbi:hypothetical protein AGR4A_pTi0069 [Agrobacterium tumefaciens str. B6]|uniref:Uncharacterized protein n=1 Tax=Agrobacterium tumefaciens str. B6 TaxID=1183423 RepID=A0A822VD14_AGRTU|nr:hypothetical protein X971_5390 [Agrobacterium tumefaciens LBA4213 (Ach5)]CUX06637.1 hypothetical protein AGR1C_pTi0057 [Agrobacterium fabacearum TT111]CVI25471.1 hypothetical protein AGR4A_pTi0069 [Agrobacterium tumefaciens str. B6]
MVEAKPLAQRRNTFWARLIAEDHEHWIAWKDPNHKKYERENAQECHDSKAKSLRQIQ